MDPVDLQDLEEGDLVLTDDGRAVIVINPLVMHGEPGSGSVRPKVLVSYRDETEFIEPRRLFTYSSD